MKNIRPTLWFSITILFTMISVNSWAQVNPKKLAGQWAGSLKVQSIELRLVMNISFNEADSMLVTLDSPDQGARDIPTSKVELREDSILISVKKIGGKFIGRVNSGYSSIQGSWKQGGMSLPLTLSRLDEPFALSRPQTPKPPFPYRSEEVTFRNVTGGFDLAGTLTIPEKAGKYPCAILVTGSGAQNRDEELMGHKPFLVLADSLTRQGIAVLRYDDRGTGNSGGSFGTATTFDFATDAEAAFDFLKLHPEIDTNRIGFIGHSEGGIIAPIVASRRPETAFIVLMAGPGLKGERILLMQADLIGKTMGMNEKTRKDNEKLSSGIYSILKKTKNDSIAERKIRSLVSSFDKKNKKDTSYHKMTEEELTGQIKVITSPWFRCFLTLDPEDYLVQVKCPLLAINGSLDLQVPPKENLQAIEKALIFGGNSHYTLEEMPGLNHLFQTATTGSPSEYGKIEETMSPAVLELIGRWVLGTVSMK